MVGFTAHSEFPALAPYVRVEIYARDGGHDHPRKRIELASSAPPEVVDQALALVMPCVSCGAPMRPFRRRRGDAKRTHGDNIYFAAACPLDVNVGCSRGQEARDEYVRVVAALGQVQKIEPQLDLFGGKMADNQEDDAGADDATEDSFGDVRAEYGASAGIFDASALPGGAADREDQIMGAMVRQEAEIGRLNRNLMLGWLLVGVLALSNAALWTLRWFQ